MPIGIRTSSRHREGERGRVAPGALALAAVALALAAGGCAGLQAGARGESDLAEALARYSSYLILSEAAPESEATLDELRRAADYEAAPLALHLQLGSALIRRERYAEAIPLMERAAARFPDSAAAWVLLGAARHAQGAMGPAVAAYRRAVRLDPAASDPAIKLAAAYVARGDDARALRVLDRAVARVAEPLGIQFFYEYLGRLYLDAGKLREATACFERLAATQTANVQAQGQLARCYAAAGRWSEAISLLSRLAARDVSSMLWPYQLGELYEQMGNEAAAVEQYRLATRRQPLRAEPFLRIASLTLAADREQAVATLREALVQLPEDPLVHTFLGLLMSHGGASVEAMAAFDRALGFAVRAGTVDELNPLFYVWYGAACDQGGERARAEELLRESIRRRPEVHEAHNYLAYMWAERRENLEQALALSKRSLELKPGDPAYEDTLGWIYYGMGDYERALEWIGKAVRAMPGDATLADHMGDVLAALGREEEAASYWAISLRIRPDDERVAAKLRRQGSKAGPEAGAVSPGTAPPPRP